MFRVFDSAGIVTSEEYDFKGNLLRGNRQLVADYRTRPDWSGTLALESDVFTSSTTYDALNRPVTLTTPDNSVVRPTHNEANFLERMEVSLRGSAIATEFIRDIDYDAKGQRELIEYGNGVQTTYEYDPLTFRLTRLHTQRGTDPLQDLSYVYDPIGNITDIRIAATGREHIGQAIAPQTSWNDEGRIRLPHPHDGQAMWRYTEQYAYDGVGNFLQLIHQTTNGNWTRSYAYEEASLIEPGKQSNRLSQTSVGATDEPYRHDIHGNMTSMPHLSLMQWDFQDQLQASARQVVNAGTPETSYYVYDAAGQRVRKVTERAAATPTRMHERIYLGGFERYREYGVDGAAVTLERQTLQVMDDKQRIALVETRTQGNQPGVPQQLIRYQLSNHLGSASLELDSDAAVISYEEYHPYGSTSYQAGRSVAEVSLKRYRYTGKERDKETGLSYHGARYYAPWLGRWTAADPAGLNDGVNRYDFVRGHPTTLVDSNGKEGEPPPWAIANALLQAEATKQQAEKLAIKNTLQKFSQSTKFHNLSRVEEGITASDVAMTGTIPHRFVAGQIVGFGEGTWKLATALPKLVYSVVTNPSETVPGVVASVAKTWDEKGILGFTPLPSLGRNLTNMFTAENAFEAGRAHGHARVNAWETAGLAVSGAAGIRSQVAKSLATRGILLDEVIGGISNRFSRLFKPAAAAEVTLQSQLGYRSTKMAEASDTELQLWEDVTEGEMVAIGRTAKGKGHLYAALQLFGRRAVVLDKWLETRGIKWSQRW